MTADITLQKILRTYNVEGAVIKPFGSGLINHTWKIGAPGGTYILQRINSSVFRHPEDIAFNTRLIKEYLGERHPDYFFVAPLADNDGRDMVFWEGEGWFRLTPFVENATTFDVVQSPEQAYEAARQFGRFTSSLSGFESQQLRIPIPQFHDLGLRYQQFLQAIAHGNEARLAGSKDVIEDILQHSGLVRKYQDIVRDPRFKSRVTHHDTKISNVLFDRDSKGLCVIDLDTVMPGFFISDVGDMMRTYLSPVSEEERDLEKIEVRSRFYEAIVEGYSIEMNNELTAAEKDHFLYAGKFMIYMQALRFLTDHLNNDAYYGAKYEGHNLARAKNQATLLHRLTEMQMTTQKPRDQ